MHGQRSRASCPCFGNLSQKSCIRMILFCSLLTNGFPLKLSLVIVCNIFIASQEREVAKHNCKAWNSLWYLLSWIVLYCLGNAGVRVSLPLKVDRQSGTVICHCIFTFRSLWYIPGSLKQGSPFKNTSSIVFFRESRSFYISMSSSVPTCVSCLLPQHATGSPISLILSRSKYMNCYTFQSG